MPGHMGYNQLVRKPQYLFCLLIASCLPCSAGESMHLLQESKPHVTRTGAWQSWGDRIELKAGQEELPLRIDFINGVEGRPRVNRLKAELERAPLISLDDFSKRDSFSVDLTGKLQRGYSSLTVRGEGKSGARMMWRLFIQGPVITAVNPSLIWPGDEVTIEGKNFSNRKDRDHIWIGKMHVRPSSIEAGKARFKVPQNMTGGKQEIRIEIASVKSGPFGVTVRSHPHISRVNMLASPPHHPVTLKGSGFSPVASENIVTVGNRRAEVTSAGDSHITFIIPEMRFPHWHVPIHVTSHGMPSKGRAFINVDERVIPNEGIPMR